MNINTDSLSIEKILDSFKEVISFKTLRECLKNPVYILVYQHLLSVDKTQLEKPFKYGDVYQKSKYIKNPLFFSAFVERRVLWDEQPEEIKWILDQIPHPSPELYEIIYQCYCYLTDDAKNFTSHMPQEYNDLSYHFAILLSFMLSENQTEEKNILFNGFCDTYLVENSYFIIRNYIFNNTENTYPIIKEFEKRDINYNDLYNISDYLIQSIQQSYSKNFWISSTDVKKMNNLFKMGFIIDKDLIVKDKHILNCVIESKREDIFELLIDKVNCFAPLTTESIEILNNKKKF